MADQIVIAELQINTKALQDSNTKLIQQIALLKAEQKELQTSTNNLTNASDDQSRKFIENDASLKQLNTQYSNNKKVLSEAQTGVAGLNQELQKEATSVNEATNQNTKLNIIKKQITTTTEEGRKAIEEINTKIDQNTEYIKANSSETEKQKMNIGNYKDSIKGALAELNPLNGGLTGFMERSQAAGGTGNLLNESFKGITTGVKGATVAAWEFIATPIGAIIAAIVLVATLLYDIFKNFSPLINPIKDAMAALGAVFEVVKTSIFALVTGTKSLSEVFSSFGSEASKAADDAMKLAQANREVIKANRELEISSAKAQAEITKYLVQAKNRTLSEEERIGLLDKALSIEKKNVETKLELNNKQIANARLALAEGKEISEEDMKQLAKGNASYAQSIKFKYNLDQEAIDNLRKLQVARYGIIEESSKTEEKAMNLKDKLAENAEKKEQKAIEDTKKAREDAEKAQEKAIQKKEQQVNKEIELMKSELSIYTATQNLKNKSLEDELLVAQTISEKKVAILEKELTNKKISQANYDEAIILNNQQTSKKILDTILEDSRTELNLFIAQNKSKLDSKKFLTQELINEEQKRLESIKNDQLNILEQEKNTNQSIIDEKIANNIELSIQDKEFLTEKINLETDYRNQTKANQDAFDEEVRVQKAIDLQNELDTVQQKSDEALAIKIKQLNAQRDFELKAATKNGADVTLIKEKYIKLQEELTRKSEEAKLDVISKSLGTAASLFKQNTLAYKVMKSAETVVSTASSAMKAYDDGLSIGGPYGLILGPVMAGIAVAAGAVQLAEINGVKFERGGLQEVGGNRHSAGGTKFIGSDGTAFEAEQGELIGVMNRNASRAFMDFNNQYPSNVTTTRPNVFASGGIVTQQSVMSYSASNTDFTQMADMIARANSQIPPPVVYTAITDINYQQGNYTKVVSGANH